MQQPDAFKNPLINHMRQPKLLISLPSNGKYWAAGSLTVSETGEYPVYSMTAKDELILKVPDALISGQGVVEVIQHCMPNIKNAWAIPTIDLDVILIAIRIATYGELMKVPVTVKETEFEYQVDLRYVLSELTNKIIWSESIQINPELVVYVKPFDYKTMSASAVKTFETQKLIQAASSSSMSDAEKSNVFNDAFTKLNDITVGLINNSVFKVDTDTSSITNIAFIKEFMENVDKEIYDQIKQHVETLRIANAVKPLKIAPTQEMIDAGCDQSVIEIPLVFDPSTFFG